MYNNIASWRNLSFLSLNFNVWPRWEEEDAVSRTSFPAGFEQLECSYSFIVINLYFDSNFCCEIFISLVTFFFVLFCFDFRYNMAAVDIVLSGSLSVTDPERNPVLIVGKLSNLRKVDYSKVQCKFNDKVSEEVY